MEIVVKSLERQDWLGGLEACLAALYFNEPSTGRVFERDIGVWCRAEIQVAQCDERMMQTDSEIGHELCKLLC